MNGSLTLSGLMVTRPRKDRIGWPAAFFEYGLFEEDIGGILEGYELARLLIAMREARDAVYL